MAKSGVAVADSDPAVATKVLELKKELNRLVNSIIDDDDCSIQTIDQAKEALSTLKDLKLRKRSSSSPSSQSSSFKLSKNSGFPEEFKCPLSKELMRDPVIVASGKTYDRPFIQKWLKAGNRTCPQTQQVLSHAVLTPNHLIREMIEQWCKNHGVELSNQLECIYNEEDIITKADHDHFHSLLEKMSSSSLSEQKAAAKELRLLTKKMPLYRTLFGETSHAISEFLKPVSASDSLNNIHPDLQEDVITTLLNISIHDNNKKLVAETPMVIPILVKALKSGTIETRSNSAATLFTLSALDSNKDLIGKSGALKPLIDLLEEGHPLAMKDVASAIFTLCVVHENKARAVREGAVSVILRKISSRVYVDELLTILALLSSHQKAVQDMLDLGAVPNLLSIMRESNCERNKENCIAILQTICQHDRGKLKEIKEEEITYRTITDLALNGTSRAKRKASGILERLNRVVNITHTA
ncbi:U-box domain-containing protein 9-like [Prosopis cineraria]|uniref:U-box domain-containing protein 9-like n=1 Tax=Prosopis cineraria TaxID=364024 RepID=UPI00240EE0FA|nr:U-box domain-containing protein 9-like [Prosopis cineraria]